MTKHKTGYERFKYIAKKDVKKNNNIRTTKMTRLIYTKKLERG